MLDNVEQSCSLDVGIDEHPRMMLNNRMQAFYGPGATNRMKWEYTRTDPEPIGDWTVMLNSKSTAYRARTLPDAKIVEGMVFRAEAESLGMAKDTVAEKALASWDRGWRPGAQTKL